MESVEVLNQRLIDYYGIDSNTGRPIFRIVWANDQLEKRMVEESDGGVRLLYPQVLEMKKYPYLKDMYVLERLVIVPEVSRKELLDVKQSYEPVWTYCDVSRNPLTPIWQATQFVVDALYAAMGKKSLAKYIEDEKETTVEGREQQVEELQQELFGNETDVSDALAYGDGVVVPSTYKKES